MVTLVLLTDGARKTIAIDPATGETTSNPATALHNHLDTEVTDLTEVTDQAAAAWRG